MGQKSAKKCHVLFEWPQSIFTYKKILSSERDGITTFSSLPKNWGLAEMVNLG